MHKEGPEHSDQPILADGQPSEGSPSHQGPVCSPGEVGSSRRSAAGLRRPFTSLTVRVDQFDPPRGKPGVYFVGLPTSIGHDALSGTAMGVAQSHATAHLSTVASHWPLRLPVIRHTQHACSAGARS
jgi:hypothetical protein